jgi:polysaccharide export outer membrane protein
LKSPSVTAEVRVYRPFFILGEVGMAGQYPYVPGMTARAPSPLPSSSPARQHQVPVHPPRRQRSRRCLQADGSTAHLSGDTVRIGERYF